MRRRETAPAAIFASFNSNFFVFSQLPKLTYGLAEREKSNQHPLENQNPTSQNLPCLLYHRQLR